MSQTRWNSKFTSATYGPVVDPTTDGDGNLVDPSRTLLDQGEVGPADMVLHEVAHYLRQSAVHLAVFAGRVDAMQIHDPEDFRKFPRLSVCLASIANTEKPTAVTEGEVTVYVGHWWDQLIAEPIADGDASIATMHWHTRRVLQVDKARTLALWFEGSQRSISTQSVVIGPERYGNFINAKGRQAFLSEIPFTYKVRADRNSGALVNFQA